MRGKTVNINKHVRRGYAFRFRKFGIRICGVFIAFAMISTILRADDGAVIVDGNTRLAFELYGKLKAENAGRNLFISPFSISTALAMTYAGARGETEKQMMQTLHFSLPQPRLHAAFSGLLADLERSRGYELAIANRLWGQKGYPFLNEYLKSINAHYKGGFEEVDYAGAREQSRQTINKWTEDRTRQKIKNLLLPQDITQLTRLVLTNAIYFKGNWASKFDSGKTIQASFRRESGESVSVPLMFQAGPFRYLGEKEFELLELPYAGDRLSMVVLLPRKGIELAKVEQLLTAENLKSWRSSMEEMEVRVFLPKFKTTTRFYLNNPLIAMGMPNAFDENLADFSGIMGKKDLYISKVIHKAFVDVNEEGTEAAAATAVVMSTKSFSRNVEFRADHPFVFTIMDRKSGSILFLGRLMDPTQAE